MRNPPSKRAVIIISILLAFISVGILAAILLPVGLSTREEARRRSQQFSEPFGEPSSASLFRPAKPESWEAATQREVQNLSQGSIVSNPPASMQVGVRQQVKVLVARDTLTHLKHRLEGHGKVLGGTLLVSPVMSVDLEGADFAIKALNHDRRQFLAGRDFTRWNFDVTPSRSGSHSIAIIASIIIRGPDGEETKEVPVFDRAVQVRVNPVYSLLSFLQKLDWKWVFTSVVGGTATLTALGKWLLSRKRSTPQPSRIDKPSSSSVG